MILDDNLERDSPDDERYLQAWFGSQSDYYLKRYKAYRLGAIFTFNAGPFFTGLFWFMYRKMFAEAAIVILINMIINMLAGVLYSGYQVPVETQTIVSFSLLIPFAILYGGLGNYFYFRKTDRDVYAILQQFSGTADRIKALEQRGGTSPAPFILLAGMVILLILTLM